MTVAAAPAQPYRGSVGSRLRAHRVIIAVAAMLLLFAIAALVAVVLLDPPSPRPPCSFGEPCPPETGAPRALQGAVWTSSVGAQIEYDPSDVVSKRADTIVLKSIGGWLEVITRRSTDYQGLYREQLESLKEDYSLVESHNLARTLLGPNVGYQRGIGADYCGNLTTSQGGVSPVDTIVMAASKEGVSTFVALVTADCSKTHNERESPFDAHELRAADKVLNTFRWPSEAR
jgi:hypothetical protein